MQDWREQLQEYKYKVFPELRDKMITFSNKKVKAKKYGKLYKSSKGAGLFRRKYSK